MNSAFLPQAANLFCEKFKNLRQVVACIPASLEEPQPVIDRLDYLTNQCPAVMALDNGQLVGYLAAWLIEDFRHTRRKAAYSPEWGHAALPGQEHRVYRALYRIAADRWTASGCQVHAITLLASDHLAEKTWFWNGFGLVVVDAVRPSTHWAFHPRVLSESAKPLRAIFLSCAFWMTSTGAITLVHLFTCPLAQAGMQPIWTHFWPIPHNSVWLALDGNDPAGFICFSTKHQDSVEILEADSIISITGAYVRPAYRGRGIATHLVDRALQDYARQGFTCCSVDFESANPEAASFWPRYFEPVCYSLMRIPEYLPGVEAVEN